MGVAVLELGHLQTVKGWIAEADMALYDAKRADRDQVVAATAILAL